jgi:hypothetical protein
VTLGAAAGGVLGGWLVDRAGRKLSLLLCAVPFVVGFAVIAAAQDVWMVLGGRLLTGLACGVASLVAPVSVSPGWSLHDKTSSPQPSPRPGKESVITSVFQMKLSLPGGSAVPLLRCKMMAPVGQQRLLLLLKSPYLQVTDHLYLAGKSCSRLSLGPRLLASVVTASS